MSLKRDGKASVDDFILMLSALPSYNLFSVEKSDISYINWNTFVSKAYAEGISGLLFYNIIHYAYFELIPKWVVDKLQEDYLYNTGRNIFIEGKLKELFGVFQDSKLSVLVLRGAVFFKRIYPSLGVRPMADVDIVIRREDHPKAEEILIASGYDYPKGYPFLFYKDGFYVDLHLDTTGLWRVASWPGEINIRRKEVWDKTESINNSLSMVRVLWDYDSLLACCEHLQRHSFKRLIWFIDVSRLIKYQGDCFDWDVLVERSGQFGLERALSFVVRYLDMAGLVFVPSRVLAYFDSRPLNSFERKSLKMLLSNQRNNIPAELLFLSDAKGIKAKLMLIYRIIYMHEDRLPLAVEHIGVWGYLKRACKIIGHIIVKILSLLKPVGDKL